MASAQIVVDEINDIMELLDTKVERLAKNVTRYGDCRNKAEKAKLKDSCHRDVDKITSDISSAKYDLKRLPKDREQEYLDKLT